MTKLLLANGCSKVAWKFPDETGFYQPIVVDRFVYSVNLFAYIQTTSFNRSLYWIMIVFLVMIGCIKLILIKLDMQKYNKVATLERVQ